MSNENILNLDNARKEEQINVMKQIIADGVCPFCEDNFEKYHPKPVLFKTGHWIITENAWPYECTKNHFLLVYRSKHIEDSSDILPEAFVELNEIVTTLRNKHNLGSGTLLMRFGDMSKTGATVKHIHAQIIEGNPDDPNYNPKKGVLTRVG
jgi:diadenosine tetraphosphate (Ap4A) HIT family hydrolase